jgi:hypothetical protein
MHNDDTTAKILSFLNKQDPENNRTGIFTTGIVSLWEGHRIALFKTGDRHAGENLENLLAARAAGLPPPIQMCDALSRNVPKEYATILANCLAHARRQFVELVERFPDECTHVIEELAKIYKHDAIVKEQGFSPVERLAFHQEHSGPVMEELKGWCEAQMQERVSSPTQGWAKPSNICSSTGRS